jgi:hypothetical protein
VNVVPDVAEESVTFVGRSNASYSVVVTPASASV